MARAQYDEKMFQAARDGDHDSLVSLLVVAQPDLRRYAAHACRTSEDVNDAVQEALWIVYRHIGALRAFASLSGWMFAIVRRECLRLARRFLGSMVPLENIENELRFSQTPQFELSIDLAKAFESLPDHYREVVLLRDVEELTIHEIAERLGRTREAVKGNLHRARLLLREYLQTDH
jgi:RNA polymerase sigma factor (sigma-70 family)